MVLERFMKPQAELGLATLTLTLLGGVRRGGARKNGTKPGLSLSSCFNVGCSSQELLTHIHPLYQDMSRGEEVWLDRNSLPGRLCRLCSCEGAGRLSKCRFVLAFAVRGRQRLVTT